MDLITQEKIKSDAQSQVPNRSRNILWVLSFWGFAVNAILPMNLNIAIVAMIKNKNVLSQNVGNEFACFENVSSMITARTIADEPAINTALHDSVETLILNSLQIPYDRNGFEWDEHQQNLVMGSFYWLHWSTQILGGTLSRKIGTKFVFGIAQLISGILCSFIPIASYVDVRCLLAIRIIQGVLMGPIWASMSHMVAQWIPPNERSRFISSYLGTSIGMIIFLPIFGAVIKWLRWEYVFHLTTIMTLLWFFAWNYCVYDSPALHPRIHLEERTYIQDSLAGTFESNKRIRTPWKRILKSPPILFSIVATFGSVWGLITMIVQAPTYLKLIHGWDMGATGLLTGFPHVLRLFFSYYFSTFCDYLITNDKLSSTNVRKLAVFVAQNICGLLMIGLAYSGCNSTMAIVFLTLAICCHGAYTSGVIAGIVDMSPNFSGIIFGITGTIGCVPAFVSPFIVGTLTQNNQTVAAWKQIFLISALLNIGSGVLYILFGDIRLQHWNAVRRRTLEYLNLARRMSRPANDFSDKENEQELKE